MKSFFWRTVLCVLPCVLAAWVTWVAVAKYFRGESGGFKLGVDLVGGTILVYEIDLRKQEADLLAGKADKGGADQRAFDPVKDINILAEALKRRIDPNDLYNIIIRPASGEGRIEIVLPTGGTYRSQKAKEEWDELVQKVKTKYEITAESEIKTLQVPRGKVFELADAIQIIKAQNLWGKNLLYNKDAWERMTKFKSQFEEELALEKGLIKKGAELDAKTRAELVTKFPKELEKFVERQKASPQAAEYHFQGYLEFENPEALDDPTETLKKTMVKLTPPGEKEAVTMTVPEAFQKILAWSNPEDGLDLEQVISIINQSLGKRGRTATDAGSVKNWIKSHAWYQLQQRALKEWPRLKEFAEPEAGGVARYTIERIAPDNNEQLQGFILAGGSFVGQAGLFALENIIGANPLDDYDPKDDATLDPKENIIPPYSEVKKFLDSQYGPSHRSIVQEIRSHTKVGHDLSGEDVQRIKEQVARVGYLEFRILANKEDDKEAMDKVKDVLKNKQSELKDLAERGLPPPGPQETDGTLTVFPIILARSQKSYVTYSWVELSRQQRRELNLDNGAKDEPHRAPVWKSVENKQPHEPFHLQLDPTEGEAKDRLAFHGAYFLKRPCLDRNLTAGERDTKKWEYFVLTRDPEFIQNDKGERTTDRNPAIDGSYLIAASAEQQDFRPTVSFAFNAVGANLFGEITGKNVPNEAGSDKNLRHLAIILDGQVMSAPTIQSTIRERGQITGNFTQKEIDSLVNTLRAGRLPATLKPEPVSERTMGPTLGQDTIEAGLFSILLAFFAVLIFMSGYYRFAGMVASIALLANLLLTVGFMVAVQATFTLAGLAGLVLTLGMAVDANVLIYERLREERDRGANLALAIRNGYDRSFATIIDTHLSVIFSAIVLYVVGNDQLKGFGISLTVGLLISLFTSLFMTRLIFDFCLAKGWLTKLSMFRFFSKSNIDFMAIRKPMFTTSVILSVVGFALFFGRAPFNIDFVGGTKFGSRLTTAIDIKTARQFVSEDRQKQLLEVDRVEELQLTTQDTVQPRSGTEEGEDTAKKVVKSVNRGLYTIHYKKPVDAAGQETKRIVYLLNPPDLPTVEERVEAVKLRAQELPDLTLEQQFPSFAETQGDKSNFFVFRTTEKEPELVQAALDRLLRDEQGNSLLRRTYIWQDKESSLVADRMVKIDFFLKDPEKGKADLSDGDRITGLPLLVKSLLNKELTKEFGTTDRGRLPLVEVIGEGAATQEGEYSTFMIRVEKMKHETDLPVIQKAIEGTIERFNNQIQPDDLENFDSQFATETRYRALWAILASWMALLVYVWFRFGNWTFGLAAVLCLVHDVVFTLGAIAVCHYLVVYVPWLADALMIRDFKVDLNTVAALLTLIGYSINDKIVVYDRMREVRGKNPNLTPKIINEGINQSLSRTLLTGISVFLVLIVLYIIGGEGVHTFSFVMIIGLAVGTYSSIYVASPLLLLFGEGHHEDRRFPGGRPGETGMQPGAAPA